MGMLQEVAKQKGSYDMSHSQHNSHQCRHHGTISLGALCVTTLVPGSIATVMHVVAPVPWDVTKECDHRQCIKTRHFGTTLYFSTIIVV